jgi:hypothetical protein
MKKIISIASSFIIAIFQTSCSSLQSPYIVGEQITFLEDEVGEETVWKIDDEIYHVKIVSTNSLIASVVEWDSDKKSHALKTEEIIISELADHMFLNVKADDLYHIHYMVPSDGERVLLFYNIDSEELKKHIPNGVIETEKDSGIFKLEGSKEDIDKFILKNFRSIFDPSQATVAHLISGEL